AEGVVETLERLEAFPGVIATMVINEEGVVIRTNLDFSTTARYVDLLRPLTVMARSIVRDLDPEDDLTFLRIKMEKQEIIVA
ncbi:DLRB2 protein, partial [Centropus bengalensis]|nr:DLRB2 protein [Centropus bengalensis]